MKKIFLMLAMAAAMAAAADDVSLLTFSSKGPDAYADGTPALPGECYALVWVKDGAALGGIGVDGKALSADNFVVLTAPVARQKVVDGQTVAYCPPVLFQISNALIDRLGSGSYTVCLLDTRVMATDAEGKTKCTVGRLGADGRATGVTSWTEVESAGKATTSAVKGETLTALAGGAAPAVGAVAAVGAGDGEQPVIKAIRVEGGLVYLTVQNLAGVLRVQGGKTPEANEVQGAAVAADGSADRDVVLVVPAKGDAGYFKVTRSAK